MSIDLEKEVEISASAYEWSIRLLSLVERMLSINIKMHHDEGQLEEGEIFLFNHFARFETFIPQYLIYKETGAYCRSVASAEFFAGDDAFSNYLLSVGAVPNDHPRLIPYLAAEVLRGRKLIIFPEGGMVKDRRVVDTGGQYSIFSRTAMERRRHHTGAAVISLTLDILKKGILKAHADNHQDRLELWSRALKLDSVEALLTAARRPSTIVPANITFYPMRVSDNVLSRGVEMFNRGISRRLAEELLIEGNILFKHTDMDIRLGDAIHTDESWNWLDRKLTAQVIRKAETLADLCTLGPKASHWTGRQLGKRLSHHSLLLRDRYMHAMYSEVTVHLSHLASKIIYELLDRGQTEIDCTTFHHMLYLAVKYAQRETSIQLHRSLKNPEAYGCLLEDECKGVEQFLRTTASLALIEHENQCYRFMPKLCEEHEFDEIRTENMVAVYANEVSPLSAVSDVTKRAVQDVTSLAGKRLAKLRYEDEQVSFQWDKAYFSKPRHQEINDKETATESGEPFLFLPDNPKGLGIVLSHGFLSSPAEVKDFGKRLADLGYPVIGPRLKGHGTSPWDLRERNWKDWLFSIQRAYQIMEHHVDRICLVGFSTGGALSLRLAADQPDCLAGLIGISVPIKFRSKNMVFVPMMHHANRFVRWASTYEGVMPFRTNNTEHPHINYQSMPLRGIFELRLLVNEVEGRLSDVRCPVKLFQGDEDHVVNPRSATIIINKIGSDHKDLVSIPTERHGILNEDVGGVQDQIIEFLRTLE
ncbi:alpha/beta hydrolase [Pseudomonadota bacterium]